MTFLRTSLVFVLGCVLVACGGSNVPHIDGAPGGDGPTGADAPPGPPDAAPADAPPIDAPPFPDAGPMCDPVLQNCTGTNMKCQIAMGGTTCVAVTGSAGDGQVCMRDMSGNDDCVAGFICSGTGQPSTMMGGMRYCRAYCGADSGCAADPGERCTGIFGGGGTSTFGDCIPQCTFFGTDCPTGTTCNSLRGDIDGTSVVPICRAPGMGTAGMACGGGMNQCAADLVCYAMMGGMGACTAECDATHACTTGTCTNQPGLPAGTGLCL